MEPSSNTDIVSLQKEIQQLKNEVFSLHQKIQTAEWERRVMQSKDGVYAFSTRAYFFNSSNYLAYIDFDTGIIYTSSLWVVWAHDSHITTWVNCANSDSFIIENYIYKKYYLKYHKEKGDSND